VAFALPISLDLTGRRAVVVGGGEVGEHKARALLDAGATVTVIAERFGPGLKELARRGEVTLAHKPYTPGDLEGAFLAVAATSSSHVNQRIYEEAEERRVLLNAVDDIPHCHFAFPAVLRRGDLQVAVSTAGRAPALAKWLRGRLSRLIGPEYGDLVEVLATARQEALPSGRGMGFAVWARRWQEALNEDLLGLVRRGRIDEAGALIRRRLAGERPATRPRSSPSVAIVGAGPGDGGLMTLRGRQLLDEADVVVFDRLVSPDLVDGKHAIYVGKAPGEERRENRLRRGPTQEEINMLLILFARQGKRVVRLKGGDPFVFGRGAEEAEALGAAGVAFEVVPAPSSAIAALAYAGIPVTDRRYASSVAIVTGQTAHGRAVNWRGLAASADTIVVLMGSAALPVIVKELLAGGCDPSTPAAVVENGTLPLQRVVTARLSELPGRTEAAGLGAPSVVVVGEVVRLRDRIRWFDRDPVSQSPTIPPGSAREGQPT
jgi:uroporphyrin-III C-methyltransferase/precorrin-2 dehydrogenase/sirohydrochlorin ferrochelatase